MPDSFEDTKKAAEQGCALAQYNLGVMYANGRGAPKNEAEACAWYRKAADQGHARAQHRCMIMVVACSKATKMHVSDITNPPTKDMLAHKTTWVQCTKMAQACLKASV